MDYKIANEMLSLPSKRDHSVIFLQILPRPWALLFKWTKSLYSALIESFGLGHQPVFHSVNVFEHWKFTNLNNHQMNGVLPAEAEVFTLTSRIHLCCRWRSTFTFHRLLPARESHHQMEVECSSNWTKLSSPWASREDCCQCAGKDWRFRFGLFHCIFNSLISISCKTGYMWISGKDKKGFHCLAPTYSV